MLAVDEVPPVAASVVQIGDARERFGQWREGKAGKVLSISVIGETVKQRNTRVPQGEREAAPKRDKAAVS